MVLSKFVQSSIALLLARGALGATDVADRGSGALQSVDALLKRLDAIPQHENECCSDSSLGGAVPQIDALLKGLAPEADPLQACIDKYGLPTTVDALRLEPLLGSLLIPTTPCTAIYGNEMRPTIDGDDMKPVMEQIVNYMAEVTHGKQYAELTPQEQSEFLIIGWSGMCFAVDGRCDQYTVTKNGKTRVETIKKKKLRCVADRKQCTTSDAKDALKNVIKFTANEMTETDEFKHILEGVKNPKRPPIDGEPIPRSSLKDKKILSGRAAYRNQTIAQNPENLIEFWKTIGNGHFAAISAFSNGKPTWLCAHKDMQGSHYQVDIGSGKAVGFKLVKEGEAEIKSFRNKRTQADFHTIREEDPISPKSIMKHLQAGNDEKAQTMLEDIAREMLKQFQDVVRKGELCNKQGKPKVSFGVTGDWRKAPKGREDLVEHRLELFRKAIHGQFAEHCAEVKVFLVTHEDEATYGALSWLEIPGFKEEVSKHVNKFGNKFRYVVSLEAGKGSTQVGVIDLTSVPGFPFTNLNERMTALQNKILSTMS